MIGNRANLGPKGLKDVQVPTTRREEGNNGDLYTQSDLSLSSKGPQASHIILVEGVVTPSFNQRSSHEILLLSFQLQWGEDLTILPPNFIDHLSGYFVLCPQMLETPSLIFSEMGLALKVADNLSGAFC